MGSRSMARSLIIEVIFLLISIAIYAAYGLTNFIFILFSLISTYFAARLLTKKKNKLVLWLTIILNALIFIIFKIGLSNLGLNNLNILAPLGIAYYTLQVISYIVDVYKDKYPAENNFIKYALYIFYFPCLLIGPIHRYNDFKEAFTKRKITLNNILNGLIRVLFGLFKKFVIAGRAFILINSLSTYSSGGAYALMAMLTYSILLYTDFSGGIDIVLGFSKILGLNLKENFNRPYFSESIKEFWNRWHMTLSNWLKDYIYIPLGGNKKGKIRQKINIMITFLVSGFWHGTTYILWGIYQGIFVAFPKLFHTKNKYLNTIITILLVSISWSFFIYNDPIVSLKMIGSLFTTFNYSNLFNNLLNLGLDKINYLVLILSTIALFVYESKMDIINKKIKNSSLEIKLIITAILIIFVTLYGIYGIGFNVEDFIYSKF